MRSVDDLLRGGAGTADHVDMLGNRDFLVDLLHLLTVSRENADPANVTQGGDDATQDRILSEIDALARAADARGAA